MPIDSKFNIKESMLIIGVDNSAILSAILIKDCCSPAILCTLEKDFSEIKPDELVLKFKLDRNAFHLYSLPPSSVPSLTEFERRRAEALKPFYQEQILQSPTKKESYNIKEFIGNFLGYFRKY